MLVVNLWRILGVILILGRVLSEALGQRAPTSFGVTKDQTSKDVVVRMRFIVGSLLGLHS